MQATRLRRAPDGDRWAANTMTTYTATITVTTRRKNGRTLMTQWSLHDDLIAAYQSLLILVVGFVKQGFRCSVRLSGGVASYNSLSEIKRAAQLNMQATGGPAAEPEKSSEHRAASA